MENGVNDGPSLRDHIDTLLNDLQGYRARVEHYIADLALFSLALDVLEHALAVDQIRLSNVPRAAYANARAAMESAQDMLVMVTGGAEYDLNGCYARAAEALEVEQLSRRQRVADIALGLEIPVDIAYGEDVLLVEAQAWEELAPGKGVLLRTALERVQASPERQRHWSGMGRRKAAEYLEGNIGGAGFGVTFDALYGLVSYHAHANMRTGARDIIDTGDGLVTFHHRDIDVEAPDKFVGLALQFACQALARRP